MCSNHMTNHASFTASFRVFFLFFCSQVIGTERSVGPRVVGTSMRIFLRSTSCIQGSCFICAQGVRFVLIDDRLAVPITEPILSGSMSRRYIIGSMLFKIFHF
jgi:hypothetical protein